MQLLVHARELWRRARSALTTAPLAARSKYEWWTAAFPLVSRWLVQVPIGVANVAVFYADVVSDVVITASFFSFGYIGWASFSTLLLLLPCVATHVSLFLYVHRSDRMESI